MIQNLLPDATGYDASASKTVQKSTRITREGGRMLGRTLLGVVSTFRVPNPSPVASGAKAERSLSGLQSPFQFPIPSGAQ